MPSFETRTCVIYKFSTFVFNKVVRWDEWGEVENVYLVYNFSYSVIYLTKIIKIDGHLTKLWHKQFVQFFRHGIYIYISKWKWWRRWRSCWWERLSWCYRMKVKMKKMTMMLVKKKQQQQLAYCIGWRNLQKVFFLSSFVSLRMHRSGSRLWRLNSLSYSSCRRSNVPCLYRFVHSGYFYNYRVSLSPLLFRGAPDYNTDTVSELTRLCATISLFKWKSFCVKRC